MRTPLVLLVSGVASSEAAAQLWQVVPSPNAPPQPLGNTIVAADALSASDMWAVGFHQNPATCTTCPAPLVIHWDGAAWSLVETPVIPATKAELTSVAAASADDVWAVGWTLDTSCGLCDRALIEHWDGTSWSVVASPSPGIAQRLYGVAAASATDVWAVGEQWFNYSTKVPLILRYDGNGWGTVATPPIAYGELSAVYAVAPDDVWAVGVQGVLSTGIQGLALHWDGAAWTQAPVPNEPGGYIWMRSISGVASNDLWAVGVYKYENHWGHMISSARAWHWDGAGWTRALYPGVAGQDSRMYAVHAVASDDVWAVGGGDPPFGSGFAFEYRTVHWDGVHWSRVENPNQAVLLAVGGSSPSDVWALGWGMDSLGYSTGTYTMRYEGPPLCYANCDRSTAAPVLNVADFTCFLQLFASGNDIAANCDGSTEPPRLNVNDFTCFLVRFAAGCP